MAPATELQTKIDRLQRVLDLHEGVAPIREFLDAGFTRNEVAFLFRTGRLVRPRIGWYCDPALPLSAVRALRVGGVLGCTSAAASWGMMTPGVTDLEVSVPPDATRLRSSTDSRRRLPAGIEKGLHLHWQPRLDAVRGFRVAPVDALLQMSGCVTNDWLTAAIDSALRARSGAPLLSPGTLERLRSALPERARSAVDSANPRSESVPETFARLGLERAGIPHELQVPLLGRYRVDILIDGWIVFEVDGAAFHDSARAFAEDRARDADLARSGYRVFRATYRQIVDEWPMVLRAIQQIRLSRPC